MEVAKLIREDYLQQNGFSTYDKFCPMYKTQWMLRNFVTFFELGKKAINESSEASKITWSRIKASLEKEYVALTEMKFLEPSDGEAAVTKKLQTLNDDLSAAFQELQAEF